MMKQGDAVVYKCKGIYKVADVGKLDFTFVDRKREYYTLQSLENDRERVYVPTDDDANIREPMEKEEVFGLIQKLDDIEVLWVQNEKLREREYKECIAGYSPENWVRVLKTLYERTKSRGSMTSMDKKYQQLLEHALYSEIAYVMGISESQVQKFITGYRQEKK